jgi:magnesium transporter
MYPTEKSLDILADMLGLHPLTVEDCLGQSLFKMARTHRQKVEAYENYVFLASSEVQNGTVKNTSNTLSSHDLFCAVFPNLIITFHSERLICIQEARERLAKTVNDVIDEGLHPTVEWILYALLDAIIDQQGSMIDLLDSEAVTLDDLILNAGANDQLDFMHRILSARRRCSYLHRELEEKLALLSALTAGHARRAVGGHEGQNSGDLGKYIMVGEKLVSPDELFQAIFEVKLSEDIRLHLRDVVSNIESMQVALENTSDSITNTSALYLNRVNIQLSEGSNELTQGQKFFAAIATIGLPLGFVTTAWGQNVGVPGAPPTDNVYPDIRDFFGILGGLLAFAILVLIVFWRLRWL